MCKVRALPVCAIKAYRGTEAQLHTFLHPALDVGERVVSHPRPLYPRLRDLVLTEYEAGCPRDVLGVLGKRNTCCISPSYYAA